MKRAYSFTVDGPVALKPEDLPDEVSGVLPDADTMFQVLVEGTVESEIILGVRFAKKLAKACHGVAVDEQTGEVWPKPRVVRPVVPKVSPYKDLVHFSWYALADEMPADLPERYVRLAKECLPEALPVRFGDYEPYRGDFVRDSVEGLMRQWKDSPPLSLVRPYLTGHLEEYPQGIFHSWTEKPAGRREIARVLPHPEQPGIPQEFCGVYEDEKALFPTSLAVNVPPRLREVRMPLHQYED